MKDKTIYISDEKTKYFAAKDSGGLFISSNEELQSFISNKFLISNVVILVELDWDAPISTFHGYEVAKQLMNSPNRTKKFNLLFVSTFCRETLFQIYRSSNRIFITKFSHVKIGASFDLKGLKVPEYSERKFNYLRNYCFLKAGILDRLIHDVRNLRNNFKEEKYKTFIDDLYANSDIISNELTYTISRLKNCVEVNHRNTLLDDVHGLLHAHQKEIGSSEESYRKKSRAKILLVEDNRETRDKLVHTFSYYFSSIEACGSGSEAFSILKAKGKQIDVVLTDMELLYGNFDEEKQGIDILELCEAEHPHLVTRIITALPKNAVKKLLGVIEDNIIYKGGEGDGVLHPLENIYDFVEKIDEDVARHKVMRSMTGPANGRFKKCLTKQLYLKKMEDIDEYTAIWNDAKSLAKRFIDNELDALAEDEKVPINFGRQDNDENGWQIVRTLLTHRLITLWSSSSSRDNTICYFESPGGSAYVDCPGFQSGMENKSAKSYFTTHLGFSAPGASSQGGKDCDCKIVHQDLFPEERSWLEKYKPGISQETKLEDIDFYFNGMFMEFFNTYNGNNNLDENTKFGDAIMMLNKFISSEKYSGLDSNLLNNLADIFNDYYGEYYNKENIDEQLGTYIKSLNHIFSNEINL